MSNPITIEYRGYEIGFSENEEKWRCHALDVDGEKLSTVKTKIDKVIAASRKIGNVPAIYRDYHDRVIGVTIVAIAQPRKDRRGVEEEPENAWCMVPGRERYFDHDLKANASRPVERREKLRLSHLYRDTADNRARMAEAARIEKEIAALNDRRKAVLESAERIVLTTLTVGDPADQDSTP